jgi:Ca2+-binding EF-hand superfamily protein
MKVDKATLLLGAFAAALAIGPAHAAGNKDKDPGFNALDKDHSGYLSRTEAAGNPGLVKKFKQADRNKDGKLSRTEYLTVMAKKDLNSVKQKVSNFVHKDKSASSSSSTGSSKARQ